jgi:hypothetical protein
MHAFPHAYMHASEWGRELIRGCPERGGLYICPLSRSTVESPLHECVPPHEYVSIYIELSSLLDIERLYLRSEVFPCSQPD